MSIRILTSMFPEGFNEEVSKVFQRTITQRDKFAFVASEFEKMHEKTDYYFQFFLNMFAECGIQFKQAYVVDGRLTETEAQKAVEIADVVWLSGGNTPVQFRYFQKYGLDKVLSQHQGIIIGMSAGSINMAETTICTLSCGHREQEIYSGLGCVDISVEPHFNIDKVSDEILELSKEYVIYGLCDDAIIVCKGGDLEFYGEIYKIEAGNVERMDGR